MNKQVLIILCGTIAIVAFAAAFASSHPDGLEWVAEKTGFISRAAGQPMFAAPLPDYAVGIIKGAFWSTAAAGAAGALVVYGVVWAIGLMLRKGRQP